MKGFRRLVREQSLKQRGLWDQWYGSGFRGHTPDHTTWSDKTPEQIYEDVQGLLNTLPPVPLSAYCTLPELPRSFPVSDIVQVDVKHTGYPTLVSMWPNQCESVHEHRRCMQRMGHQGPHSWDLGEGPVFWGSRC